MPQNGAGTASLITGIAALVTCFTFFLGLPLAIAAVITGVKGRNAAAQGLATNGSSATAGLVMGIIGLAINALIVVVGVVGFANSW